MLNEKLRKEIREMEEAGLEVVAIGSNGTLDYSTKSTSGNQYCDQCASLRLLPDPDPYDWFRDGDMKAVCIELNAVIAGSLEPGELTDIAKPLYCPKLCRELTEEEKKKAEKQLGYARRRMEWSFFAEQRRCSYVASPFMAKREHFILIKFTSSTY